MKTRLLFVPLILALVASLAACGSGSQAVPANAVAVVNGAPITIAQFNTFFKQAMTIAKLQGQPLQPGTPQYTAARDQVVAFLVELAEVKQQGTKQGVSVTQGEVDKYISNLVKTQYQGSMKKFEATLKKQGLTMDIARQEIELNLLGQKIKTKVTSTAEVTEAQEKAFYTANIAQYHTPAQTTRNVEHILVTTKSLANTLEQKLKNGASFAALAKQYSKDTQSAAQGGKFTATQGSEVPAYDKTAFSLKTGALSAPVDATSTANGGYGWFIIKALGPVKKTAARTTPFSEVKNSIQQTLLQQSQNDLWQQWLSDLQKEYQTKVSYQSGYAPPTTTALPTTT